MLSCLVLSQPVKRSRTYRGVASAKAEAQTDTQFTFFDLSALKKQSLISDAIDPKDENQGAKKYGAQKLEIDVMELTDEEVMHQVRQDLDNGTLPTIADCGFSSGIKDLGDTYIKKQMRG